MNKFGVFTFSDKEIGMIVTMVQQWANGYILPVDRRTITKQVGRWALGWGLVEMREGRMYYKASGFNPLYDMPVQAIWQIVKPMLNEQGHTGYSIVNNKGWENLNIYPQNSRLATDRDLEEKQEILGKLASYHYIYFQSAATIWNIELYA